MTYYNKKYATGHQKRTSNYNTATKQPALELPQKLQQKIGQQQYKKIKETFYVMSSSDLQLNFDQFAKTLRALGIIAKTSTLYEIFDPKKQKKLTWEMFLQHYIALRNNKGSFKEVDVAVNLLDKQYNGRWELLFKDLEQLGDVLDERQLRIFKQEIIGNQVINSQNLKNALLGYK